MKTLFDTILREKIREYVKNRLDISDLIKDRNIKGENLSYAIIKELDIHDEDVSECNFAHAIIGTSDNIINFNRAILKNCCFMGTTFPGIVWARRADFRNCNFKDAFAPYVDYRYSMMQNSTFCNTIFSISSEKSHGACFSKDFFKDLADKWGLVFLYQEEYEKLINNQRKE